ncbi:MAG: M48 family metallopeptidase [Planctomycetes bacterium]|nr:M48 family metallopeptidase [Planctomycetota bacterium]
MKATLIIPFALALCACSIVKETGRKQVTWFPSDYMNQMGVSAYAEATSQYPEITSGPQYEMVQRIGRKIAIASGAQYDWEFKLLDAPTIVNAFALPGGKVAVYSGILQVTQNEDALAAVLGHEVAHATANHGNERMTQNMIQGGALTALDIALAKWGEMDNSSRETWMSAIAAGADILAIKPYSRKHESEADEIGLRYLIRAGYDPEEAPKLWERMAALNPDRGPTFTSTHPDPLDRAKRLRELIPRFVQEERGH